MLGITKDHVVNFDETHAHFSPEFWTMIAERGSQTVAVCKPYSNLGCTMEGKKFPPFVTFQGTKN